MKSPEIIYDDSRFKKHFWFNERLNLVWIDISCFDYQREIDSFMSEFKNSLIILKKEYGIKKEDYILPKLEWKYIQKIMEILEKVYCEDVNEEMKKESPKETIIASDDNIQIKVEKIQKPYHLIFRMLEITNFPTEENAIITENESTFFQKDNYFKVIDNLYHIKIGFYLGEIIDSETFYQFLASLKRVQNIIGTERKPKTELISFEI